MASGWGVATCRMQRPLPSRVNHRNEEFLTERARVLLSSLPHERTIGNQLRRPLTWVLAAADVPLSVGATAVGWILMVLLE